MVLGSLRSEGYFTASSLTEQREILIPVQDLLPRDSLSFSLQAE